MPEEEVLLFRASYAQQRMWFLHRLDPQSHYYNTPLVLRFTGQIDSASLQKALSNIITRHEILRTTFAEVEGNLVQVVSASSDVRLKRVRMYPSNASTTDQEANLRTETTRLIRQPFDLGSGPLLHATLLESAPDISVLVLVLHHIVVDGWSIGILLDELRAEYAAEIGETSDLETPALASLTYQLGDFAEDEYIELTGPNREMHLNYWRTQLAGSLRPPPLPFDRSHPPHPTYRGSTVDFTFPHSDTAALRTFSREANVTSFMTLLASFYVLLNRYSGETDFVVGAPMANREDQRVAKLIGLFVNTLPLRARVDPDAGFETLVKDVSRLATDAYEHQSMPLDLIVEDVAPERSSGTNPLVSVLFAVQSVPPTEFTVGTATAKTVVPPSEVTRADLELHFWELADSTIATLVYSTDVFDHATVEKLRDDYLSVLRSAIANPTEPIRALPLHDGSIVKRATLERLHDYEPSMNAFAGSALSHAELQSRAHTLAASLPVAGDAIAALTSPPGPSLIVELIAALLAGHRRVIWAPKELPQRYFQQLLNNSQPLTLVSEKREVQHNPSPTPDAAARFRSALAEPIGVVDHSLAKLLLTLLTTGTVDPSHDAAAFESVLTPDGRSAPVGIVGELCISHPNVGAVPTGIAARRHQDGKAAPVSDMRGPYWDGYRWTESSVIESVLVSSGLITDCVVMTRRNTAGTDELVAYVSGTAVNTARELADFARSALPEPLVPHAVVVLPHLPISLFGDIDIVALQRIPVVDSALADQWARVLTSEAPETLVDITEPSIDIPRIKLEHTIPLQSPRDQDRHTDGIKSVEHRAPLRSSDTRSGAAAAGPVDGLSILDGGPPVEPSAPTLPAALARAAKIAPSSTLTFIENSDTKTSLSYEQLLREAEIVLHGLRNHGLRSGDVAILRLPRNEDFVVALWGCLLGGIMAVPIDSSATGNPARLRSAWEMLKFPVLITNDGPPPIEGARTLPIGELRAGRVPGTHGGITPDDPALLLLTSGSTGAPKAVVLTHRNIVGRSAGSAKIHSFGPDDCSFNWMPLDHVGGVVMFHLRDVCTGSSQVHAPTAWILADPLRWPSTMSQYRVTATWAPNFAFGLVTDRLEQALAEDTVPPHYDLSRLTFVLNAGEAVVPRSARRFIRALTAYGMPDTAMHPGWGMSETSSATTYSRRFRLDTTTDSDEFTEVGQPIPGVRIRIVDERDVTLPAGQPGRLQISGVTITSGYYGDSEKTAEAFAADGWFDTGDIACIDNGALTITGRAKDVIVINGVNYACHTIESAAEESRLLQRSFTSAIGVRVDDRDTDSLAIIFSVAQDADETAAINDIRAKVLAAIGLSPEYVISLEPESIPKTDIGKIQRTQLRQRFEAGEFADAISRSKSPGVSQGVPNWFYQPVWTRCNRRPIAADTPHGPVLIIGPDGAFRAAIADELRTRGIDVAEQDSVVVPQLPTVTPTDSPRLERIVFIPSSKETSGCLDQVSELVQLINSSPSLGTLHIVTRGALPVVEGDHVDPGVAALSAVVRTAVSEVPGLNAGLVDLADEEPDITDLVDEFLVNPHSDIAFRSGIRLVRAIERVAIKSAKATSSTDTRIAQDGLHLIAGGAGGLGIKLAQFLVERYGAKVVLVGRSALDERQQAELAKQTDSVQFHQADVADLDRLRTVIATAEGSSGRLLSGIWHLAGVYQQQPLSTTTSADLAVVLQPKVEGIRALHEIALQRPGIRFVSFSSVNGYFGGSTVGGYSAANAYVDAFAHYQRTSCGIDAQSIAWTMWEGTGMGAVAANTEIARLAGFHIMNSADGMDSLAIVLATSLPHVLVGVDASQPAIRRQLLTEPVTAPTLTAYIHGDRPPSADVPVNDRYGTHVPTSVVSGDRGSDANTSKEVAPRDETEELIWAAWRQVLAGEQFGVTDNFFDLGGHSIALARTHGLLESDFPELSLVDMFRYPTIATLAAHLTSGGTSEETASTQTHSGSNRAQIRREVRTRRRRR